MFVHHCIHKFTWTSPYRKMQTPVSSTLNRLGDLGLGLLGTGNAAGECGYIILFWSFPWIHWLISYWVLSNTSAFDHLCQSLLIMHSI